MQDMLAENWGSKAEDIAVGSADRTGTAAPAFNPAAAEYNVRPMSVYVYTVLGFYSMSVGIQQ